MRFKSLLAAGAFFLVLNTAFAATKTSNASGPWTTGATWVGGVVPAPGDDVIITANHNVSYNTTITIQTLTMNSVGILTFTGGTLNVTGNVTFNGTTQVLGVAAATLNIGGSLNVNSAQIGLIGGVTTNVTGTTNITGYLAFGQVTTGLKTFNNTITVFPGATWDNLIGQNIVVNCSIVNRGEWPLTNGGTYTISTPGTYTFSGPKTTNMFSLVLGNAGINLTNLGYLMLNTSLGNALTIPAGSTYVNDGLLTLAGSGGISNAGTVDFTKISNVADYAFAGAQSILNTQYYNLYASTSGTKLLTGNTNVINIVQTSGSALLSATTNTFDGTAKLLMLGTSSISFGKTGAANLPEFTGVGNSFAAGTTVIFNGSGSQIAKGSSAANPSTTNTYPYQSITLSGTNAASVVNVSNVSLIQGNLTQLNLGKMTLNPVMTIGGTYAFSAGVTQLISNDITMGSFLISAGTLNYTGRTLTVNGTNGTWTNNGGGTFINGGSNVIFTTGANQSITGNTSTSFSNLTINNPGNLVLNGVDILATNVLTLTTGRIITGANSVYVSGGSVSRTTGFVDGILLKDIPLGSPTVTFEIGSGTVYTPVVLTFTSVTGGGIFTAFTTNGDNPGIAASNIDPLKSANRFWSLRNNSTAFTSVSIVFNFVAGDLDGAATPANFAVRSSANGGVTWNATTTGTLTATSTQIVGEPSAAFPNTNVQIDFQAGELNLTTLLYNRITGGGLSWNNKATWIEHRTGTITFTAASAAVTGVGTLFLTELADGDVLMMQTNSGVVMGTIAAGGRTSNTTLTLTANAAGAAAGGYGRQRVPNLVTDVVTIGNPNIVVDAATSVNYDMPAATTINTLNINTFATPRATAQTLVHMVTTNALTVQANAVISQATGAGPILSLWNVGGGQAAVPGTITLGSIANNTNIARISLTTGTLTVGSVLFNTGNNAGNELTASIAITGAAQINMSGSLNFTNDRGSMTPGTTSSFNFNGTAAQILTFPGTTPSSFAFNNLLFNNSSSTGLLVSPPGQDITTTNVLGDVRVQSGILVSSDNTDFTGNTGKQFQILPGATFRMTGTSSTFPVFPTYSLGVTAPFGTVKYEQQNAASVTAAAYGNLQVLYSGVTYTLPATGASVAGNLTIGDGTSSPTLIGNNTTAFTVTGDVIINKNATFNQNVPTKARITVGGNWTNNGTFVPSSAAADVVTFTGVGTSPLIISGTGTESFNRMTVNMPAAKLLQLNRAVTVSGVLTLTAGGIDLNGNTLNVTNSIPGAVTRTSGYVKSEKTSTPYGELNWTIGNNTTTFTWPFGKSQTEYIPFSFTANIFAGNVGANLSVATYATPPNNLPLPTTVTNLNGTTGGNSIVDRYWVLTPSNMTIKPVGTMLFTAVGSNTTPPSEKPASIPNLAGAGVSIVAQSWSNSKYWNAPPPSQTFANNSPAANFFQVSVPLQVIQNNVIPYTLVDALTPLPIKLVEFTAQNRAGMVELNWNTETEVENDFFTVEKSDGIEGFGEVVKVKGAGTSTIPKSYSAFDNQASPGKWYYRLKQTDFNGNFTYSKIVAVDILQGLRGVYPNPSSGSEFNFNFYQSDLGKDVLIKVQDISGKELSQFIVEDLQTDEVKLEFSQKLSSGIYIVSIITGQDVVRQKVVVK